MAAVIQAPVRHRVSSARVLLIEDNADIAVMYRIALEIGGHRVTVASDGEAGLAVAADMLPDVVLLDLRLPRMHGLEVLEEIRRRPRTSALRVVILSNSFSQPEVKRSYALGALAFLVKSSILPAQVVAGIPLWAAPDQEANLA